MHLSTQPFFILLSCLSLLSPAAETLLAVEDFAGPDEELSGTVADTFARDLRRTGGSPLWISEEGGFKQNGLSGKGRQSALLDIGDYINRAKGTHTGIFRVAADLPAPNGNGIAFGFFNDRAKPNRDFLGHGAGRGIFVRRGNNRLNVFPGPGIKGRIQTKVLAEGTETLTVEINLSHEHYAPQQQKWGTLNVYRGAVTEKNLVASSKFDEDVNFRYIGISLLGNERAVIKNFRFTQNIQDFNL